MRSHSARRVRLRLRLIIATIFWGWAFRMMEWPWFYRYVIRPVFFRFDAERTDEWAMEFLGRAGDTLDKAVRLRKRMT